MASTKNTTNKSGQKQSSGKKNRKKKKSSDDSLKFLLVLVIAGIAIALIFISGSGENPADGIITGTPLPTTTGTATETPAPTKDASQTPSPTKAGETPDAGSATTPEPTATVTPVPTATLTPTPTPVPTPALTADAAEKIVKEKVDTSLYNIQLVNSALSVGNGRYYQFGAISGQEFVYPFLVVSQADGSLYFYDSTEGTVFDFTKFPLQAEATPTPTQTPAQTKELTAKEAYQVLCTYPKESLKIAKEAAEYDAEYGSELTLINGINCYRINLSEVSNGKVRNRGEFYVSTDGTKCYYIDNDTNEFIQAVK